MEGFFVGDGLLAVVGAPRREPDHGDRARTTALDIERGRPPEFNGPLGHIGLDSGTVIAGNARGAGGSSSP